MHELSLMASVMDIAQQELERHGASRLTLLRLRYGALDQVQESAMRFAFNAMTAGTAHEGAVLELIEERLELRCPLCEHTFSPSHRDALYMPCPFCHEQTPFAVCKGEGLFLDHLEAE
jgi:hydrogenase nickel incorporation protein HypA/HybF